MNIYSDPIWMEELAFAVMGIVTSGIPSFLFGIATYVLSALALYTVAKRRGIRKAWLSWVPVLNVWILGSLSDQYRYVVKGQIKSKRKILLILNSITVLISIAVAAVAVSMCVELFRTAAYGVSEDAIMHTVLGPAMVICGLVLPLVGVGIAAVVLYYMAMYDVYTSMDPSNNVLFLVLSIFFRVTEPFFLFFNRNRDDGMPPRKQPPVPEQPRYQPEEEEPWQEPKRYL